MQLSRRMTVDFPASYPASVAPTGKTIDAQTLQQTFAALLRSYGTEKGGSQTETLLEIIRPASLDGAEGHDRNQQRREHQHAAHNDFTQIDRKLLNKSEIRSGEMSADYRNRLDQREVLHNDYRERIERSELSPSTLRADASPLTLSTASSDTARPSEVLPSGHHAPPQHNTVPHVSAANSPPPLTATTVLNSGLANVGIPVSMNVPASMPTPTAPQTNPSAVFTVFTPSGRLGQSQKEADDKDKDNGENDEEEVVEEKTSKKQQPFAVFEAVRLETTRSLQRTPSRPSKEPVTHKETNEKPKEVEPHPFRSAKTMAELLDVPIQNVAVPKKGEPSPSNQAQYLHRIAAACEAASQYAPIRMKINLDHLGTLTLRFFYKADKLVLRFDTPSKESARFVRDNLDGLRTILSKRNVTIVDMEIYQETAEPTS